MASTQDYRLTSANGGVVHSPGASCMKRIKAKNIRRTLDPVTCQKCLATAAAHALMARHP